MSLLMYRAKNWEEQFKEWAKPPGKTEQDRCANAESAIKNAIKASKKLQSRNVSVFTQGSYRNNTNVRKDSDVDIGVVCNKTFFYILPKGKSKSDFTFIDSDYSYRQFKDEVGEALRGYFGTAAVTRGNKAFDVHETSYHVEADVAPFFLHRRYNTYGSYVEGVELRTDREGIRIINWPEQHYKNGVGKNNDTGRRYKGIVRVMKALSNQMAEEKTKDGDIPGFLIECLVWNVPNDNFGHYTYTDDVRSSLVFLYQNTKTDAKCSEWTEVSGLKYLFHPEQKWTRAQVNAFAYVAWNFIGFNN